MQPATCIYLAGMLGVHKDTIDGDLKCARGVGCWLAFNLNVGYARILAPYRIFKTAVPREVP